jgi:Tfp pilus assembly protein PilF
MPGRGHAPRTLRENRAMWLAVPVVLAATAAPGAGASVYLDAIERYRRGDRYVAGEAEWAERISEEIGRLKRRPPEGFSYEAAAMLHTERDIYERDAGEETEEAEPDSAPQLDAARQILALIPDEERRRAFERPWFLAVVLHLFRRGQWPLAVEYADAALRRYADDPLLLLARGSLVESQTAVALPEANADVAARRPSRQAGTWSRRAELYGRLRDAEASYRRALRGMPELVEARVRLGRVLYERGEPSQAAQELAAAAADPQADPPTRYLAWLFLGAAREAEKRPREAVEAYRAAVTLDPDGAVAPIALSHALHEAGDRGASQEVLRTALSAVRRRKDWDPWWNYRWGRSHEAEERLEALRQKVRY